jgi:hypothetical protein
LITEYSERVTGVWGGSAGIAYRDQSEISWDGTR